MSMVENPNTISLFINELKDTFFRWKFLAASSRPPLLYITFSGGTFSDVFYKRAGEIARKYDFSLLGFGVIPTGPGKLLITFMLSAPKSVFSAPKPARRQKSRQRGEV